jgi:hypothetical protein
VVKTFSFFFVKLGLQQAAGGEEGGQCQEDRREATKASSGTSKNDTRISGSSIDIEFLGG